MPIADPATERLFARLTWAVVGLGVLVRVLRFVLPFPLWGDEVFVCQNFLDRDFVTILHQLENGQICPPLFLWAQLAVFRLLGGGEMAMRLLPVLAGLVALVWFARLARRLVPPFSAFLAVGFLSLAYWPVSLSTCAKPYSFDLLAAVAVTAVALHWRERTNSVGRGVLFAVVCPLALLGSYTAAFAFGGAALAVLPAVWRSGWVARGLFTTACVLVLAAFAFDLRVGTAQADSAGAGQGFIYDYWRFAFPPPRIADFPLWLLSLLTGRMFAYPIGDANGGSTLTFLMCVVGGWRWWRDHPRWQLVLLVAPIGLNLLAAVIGKYPFGGCGRLTQYAAPAICLLAGVGSATTLRWLFRSSTALRSLGYFYAVVFLALAAGHIVIDVRQPYHDPEANWVRNEINGFARELGPDDRVVVRQPRDTDVTIPRYHFRLMGERVTWGGQWPTGDVTGSVWVVDVWMAAPNAPHTPPPAVSPPGWALRETRRREHLWPDDQNLALTLVYERYTRDP